MGFPLGAPMSKAKHAITVRKGTRSDIPLVLGLQREAWHEGFAASFDYLWCSETLETTIREIRTYLNGKLPEYPNPESYLAFCDGKLAGALTCGKHRTRFWVWDVFVRKRFRGLGIGERLLKAALKGRKEAYIEVNVKNPALKFWTRMGFKPLVRSVVMVRE